MPDEVSVQSGVSRLFNSVIAAVCVAPLLLLCTTLLLGYNEKRDACDSRAIEASSKGVSQIGCTNVQEGNGNLVLFTCDLADTSLVDARKVALGEFESKFTDPIRTTGLQIKSEMLVCTETAKSTTKKGAGGQKVTETDYEYSQEWSSSVPSFKFANYKTKPSWITNCNKENVPWPADFPKADTAYADSATIGPFVVEKWAVKSIPLEKQAVAGVFAMKFAQYGQCRFPSWTAEGKGYMSLDHAKSACLEDPDCLFFDAARQRPDGEWDIFLHYSSTGENTVFNPPRLEDFTDDISHQTWKKVVKLGSYEACPAAAGGWHFCKGGSTTLGSQRISFFSTDFSLQKQMTVLGQNNNGKISKWTTPGGWMCSGKQLGELKPGSVTKDDFFTQMQAASTGMTWLLRIIGFCLAWCAFSLIASPLGVVADCIPCVGPCIGDMVEAIACVISLFPACGCFLIVAGLVWIVMRPLYGLGLLAVAALIFGTFAFFKYNRKGRQVRSLSGGLMPQGY